MRVLFHLGATESLRRRLAPLHEGLDVVWCDEHDDDRFARLLPDAEVLWHSLRPVGADDLRAAPRLRLVQKLGSGVNTIDLEAARHLGVGVANMPGTNAAAVAEATVALTLAALRRIPQLDALTRAGSGWPNPVDLPAQVRELGGATVGLVGNGFIAQRARRLFEAFDATVLHTSTTPGDPEDGWRTLDELVATSDVVSLHLPATPATEGMFDAARLAAMRPGAVLVNTARGTLVDEAALVDALRSGRLRAAALDVFAAEPTPADNPLLALDNVVVQPHVAWLTPETIVRNVEVAVDNCRRLAAGRSLRHEVVPVTRPAPPG